MTTVNRETSVLASPQHVLDRLRAQADDLGTDESVSPGLRLTMTVETPAPDQLVAVGTCRWFRMTLTFTVRASGAGSQVTSRVELALRSWARLLFPASRRAAAKLADLMDAELHKEFDEGFDVARDPGEH